MAFNPDQERDERGRFASGGGGWPDRISMARQQWQDARWRERMGGPPAQRIGMSPQEARLAEATSKRSDVARANAPRKIDRARGPSAKELREMRANHERSKSAVDRAISRLARSVPASGTQVGPTRSKPYPNRTRVRQARDRRTSRAMREHLQEQSTKSGDFHSAARHAREESALNRRNSGDHEYIHPGERTAYKR